MFASLLLVSLVVMSLAHTIAKERLFEPLRNALHGQETWLGYLVSCPYCVSHWIAFVVVPLTGVYYVPVSAALGPVAPLVRWFLSCIAVAAAGAFLRVIFFFIDEGQGLVRRRKEETDLALREGPPLH